MKVEIDRNSGFCFGVQNAVEIAEKALGEGEKVFSLGPIVHNDMEVDRLSDLGLKSVDHNVFSNLRNCKVLIRAHGEPPETYKTAAENNITIIEATCPIVKKLQKKIKEVWQETKQVNGQVVIYGKPGHAEVVGLQGQIGNEGIIVSCSEEFDKIDITRPVLLFSQTTMSADDYNNHASGLKRRMKEHGIDAAANLKVHRTTCGQVSNRESHLREFAENHDVIVFVSGHESSNGKMLYQVCKSENPSTYFVSSTDEIDPEWFKERKTAGVCGATSTPKWLIEKVSDFISTI